MRKELLKGLSDEQVAKYRACKTQEEILKLAKEEGVELSEEQLEAVSGGACTDCPNCKRCKSSDVEEIGYWGGGYHYHCRSCDWYFHD